MKSKIFTKFLQKPRFRIQPSELPGDIAMSILEKENALEKSITLELVQDLTALYTKAIEHYESHENPKYLDFQEKLQKMLVRPQIFSVLTPKSNTSHKKLPTASQSPKLFPNSPIKSPKELSADHQKQLSTRLSSMLDSNFSENFLSSHSNISKNSSKNAISVLKSQELNLNAKLSERKLKKENRKDNLYCISDMSCAEQESFLTTKSSLNTSQDFREGFDRFEQRLEQVMEKNLGERAWKVLEIKEKYEREIEEGFEGKVEKVRELRRSMQEEIKVVVEEYDKKRKAEIEAIRKELYE